MKFTRDARHVVFIQAARHRHLRQVARGVAGPAVIAHIRDALCVFCPQRKRAETFGLVYAEANAAGTPVLAHDFGSAREILAASNPPLDASDTGRVMETLMQWAGGDAPVVGPKGEFLLKTVADQWNRFSQEPDAFIEAQAGECSRPAPSDARLSGK